jgi:hypothetical protein
MPKRLLSMHEPLDVLASGAAVAPRASVLRLDVVPSRTLVVVEVNAGIVGQEGMKRWNPSHC